ncbi:MAG: hypothetical protein KQJ78_11165 [Deltaproteobacteria bacterium]|nr:hypothetical protein [Deltaproteobacteria bacterium]
MGRVLSPAPACPHYYVEGYGIIAHGACDLPGRCATCCLACGLREPVMIQAMGGPRRREGCKRACKGPERGVA